ncbi:MAG: magnesium/cobalt transporter CorA [Saprospiraceae bacterium]|nr:magnesium/cobalt transporter CorA [Saprospiraceae bacterium]
MRQKKRKTGMPPGTPMFTGDRISLLTDTTCLKYNDDEIIELHNDDLLDWKNATNHQYWLDIRGLHDAAYMERIGNKFEIHPLALEDVVDVDQRPKMDEYDNAIFVTILALKINNLNGELIKEQVTLYFGQKFLISFQEDADDFLAPIRERMYHKRGRIRPRGTDFLAYSIIDFIVDHYYEALDYIEKKLSEIDESLHSANNAIPKEVLHDMKIQIIRIRKSIYPMREVINRFIRTENPLIHPETDIYLRDLADHSIQISDMSETYQDMINSLHDLYQTEISNRMNNVMKILTIISTIFIPFNFIAGIYGMNFEHMPELKYKYGYYTVLGFMFLVSLAFLYYFRRKKWL